MATPSLPTGTVALLFTAVEGSPTLWKRHPEQMRAGLDRSDHLLEASVARRRGVLVRPRAAIADGRQTLRLRIAEERVGDLLPPETRARTWARIG